MHQNDIVVAPVGCSTPASKPRPIRGIDDWPLDPLIQLDAAYPGFLARVMTSGDMRRQAVFAALAQGAVNDPHCFLARVTDQEATRAYAASEPLVRVAVVLAHAGAGAIVTAAFGACPPRLLAFLRRLGPQPFIAPAYKRLHDLAANPDAEAGVRYLVSLGQVRVLDIEKAERLRPEVLKSKLARTIQVSGEIDRVNAVIDVGLKVCSSVTPEWLAQSLADVSSKTLLGDWLYGVAERFDSMLVEPPFFGDEETVLLASGAAILDAGRRYRNCLRTMLSETLAGQSFFYEIVRDKVIGHVKMLSDGTGYLDGLYSIQNRPVGKVVAKRIRDEFAHVGLPSLFQADRPDLKAAASLHTPWRFRAIDEEDGE